ncbi:MAG: ATP-grasp domain-containing protein [Chlamydiales bacterium]|nr:ATP-grasp domain-containing protein [Chlamydiales bacterium]
MGQKCILLTGARAPIALDLARLFAAEGHRVLAADTVSYHVCRFSRSVEKSFVVPSPTKDPKGFVNQLAQIAKQEKVDLVIPTCEEIFYLTDQKKKFQTEIFCDSFDKLQELHNKWTFYQLLQKHGFVVPETHLVQSREELSAFFPLNKKMVIKAIYSRFATKVHILNAGDSMPASIEITPEQPWIIQEYIDGRRLCTSSVARAGQLTAHATYPVIFCVGTIGSCLAFENEVHSGIQQWVQRFVKNINFTGQLSFDFIEEPSGRLIAIECNPRPASGIHLFSQDDHLSEAFFGNPNKTITPKNSIPRVIKSGMLGFGWPSAFQQKKVASFLWQAIAHRDVLFSWNDPLPFLAQPLIFAQYWRMSQNLKISLLEAATEDIKWNGPSKF